MESLLRVLDPELIRDWETKVIPDISTSSTSSLSVTPSPSSVSTPSSVTSSLSVASPSSSPIFVPLTTSASVEGTIGQEPWKVAANKKKRKKQKTML